MDSDVWLCILAVVLPIAALLFLHFLKKENRRTESVLKVLGILGAGAVLTALICLRSPDVRQFIFGPKAAATSEQTAASEARDFGEMFQSGQLLPNQLQPKLMFKSMEDVRQMLGPPDRTSEGDTEWYYPDKVTHPITGKRDSLIIKFDSQQTTEYLQAGIGGQRWPLK